MCEEKRGYFVTPRHFVEFPPMPLWRRLISWALGALVLVALIGLVWLLLSMD